MKITAEVLEVSTDQETLSLTMQGRGEMDAGWRPYLSLKLQLPDTLKNRRAYHLGRKVVLTVEAK